MKAKAFLNQAKKLDAMINNKMVEKAQWMEIATGVTSFSSGERVQSSGNQQKMSAAVDKAVDLEREIDACIDQLIGAKKNIISKIEQLSFNEYDLLHKVYIQGIDLYEMANLKGKSYSWVTTLHGRALKNLQEILDKEQNTAL